MKITKIIPESQQDQVINSITFYVTTKNAVCHLEESGRTKGIGVDLTPALNAATVEEKAAVVKLFKWVMAKAYDVAEASLPDTVFEPDV